MKVGGVIRTIDKLGRVVIPKSMCKALNIQAEDELDITVEGERIILKKYENGCIFCNRTEGLDLQRQARLRSLPQRPEGDGVTYHRRCC